MNHSICYFYCKEIVGLNRGGGCCTSQFWRTHAVKFDELLKVWRTLTELRTALFKFVKMRESLRTQNFGRTPNWTHKKIWTLTLTLWTHKKDYSGCSSPWQKHPNAWPHASKLPHMQRGRQRGKCTHRGLSQAAAWRTFHVPELRAKGTGRALFSCSIYAL